MNIQKLRTYISQNTYAKYVLVLIFFIIGTFFSWGSVLYALGQNPLAEKIFSAAKLPKNEEKEQINSNKEDVETTQQENIRKLDGRIVAPEDANHFPAAVMIENMSVVRPQSGLSKASVVYESLVEGGITRFMAIFDVQAENISQIGPVRSARPYYLDWLSEYNGLYAHCGGSPEALQAISGFGIHDLNQIGGYAQYYWRDNGRSAPHNLFTSSELLTLAMRDQNLESEIPSFESWKFFQDENDKKLNQQGEAKNTLSIDYSSGITYQVEYQYDGESNEYLRFNGGIAHTDALDGQQIRAKNVVIVLIPAIVSVGDKGRLTLDVNGEGVVYVARGGRLITGTWKKKERLDRMKFYDDEQKEIALFPGSTWVQIVPNDRTVLAE